MGATNHQGGLPGFTNRGPMLDIFAPGVDIRSAISVNAGNGFGFKSGTSMAAPHVAGAWAVLRQAEPGLSVAQARLRFRDTGAPITYLSDGDSVTTPRINLLAAIAAGSDPPVVTVNNATVTVNEGQTATNSGTVTDPDGDPSPA